MSKARWGVATIGATLFLLSLWQILNAASQLEITKVNSSNPPMTFMIPAGGGAKSKPLVLIGHGFAGSRVIMHGFALTFAHAGYNVGLWDFEGHGANSKPMSLEPQRQSLIEDIEKVYIEALENDLIGNGQVAILGHSMGSGAALDFGVQFPETAATVAVSPVFRSVTTALPRNLLLLAGSNEASFVETAKDLLEDAGGAGGNHNDGSARLLIVIPNVEHVSILFAPQTHQAARDWLDATFGEQIRAVAYTDMRIVWYGIGLVGALMVTMALAQLLVEQNDHGHFRRPLWQRFVALLAGVIGATLVLWLLSMFGVQLRTFLGLLVGGFILLWFGITGVISWLVLSLKPEGFSWRKTLAGLVIFAGLWIGVGLLGQLVWLQWVLIPRRLVLWSVGLVLLLPLFLALAEMLHAANIFGRIAWWLVYSLVLVGGLVVVMILFPGMGFLGIILPLLPLVLAFHALAAGPYRSRWSFALSGALFISWVIVAVFPLV
jgi:pimeloyl-ACP methyl ester carboxylesterase